MIDERKYRIFVISMFAVLLMFGIYIGFNLESNNNIADSAEAVINKEGEEDIEIYDSTATVAKKYDIEVVYEDYYALCGETINKSEINYSTTLDDLKYKEEEKQKEVGEIYLLKEETNERIVYYKEHNQNCPNHFNVKLENGVIVVYSIINESVSTVYQKIDISQELIRPELVEELNLGIKLDSKEELNLLIEDIES